MVGCHGAALGNDFTCSLCHLPWTETRILTLLININIGLHGREEISDKIINHKNEKLVLYFLSLWIKFNKNNLNVGTDTFNFHGY